MQLILSSVRVCVWPAPIISLAGCAHLGASQPRNQSQQLCAWLKLIKLLLTHLLVINTSFLGIARAYLEPVTSPLNIRGYIDSVGESADPAALLNAAAIISIFLSFC